MVARRVLLQGVVALRVLRRLLSYRDNVPPIWRRHASALAASLLLMPVVAPAQVSVSPDGQQTATVRGHTTGSAAFSVQNLSSSSQTYSLSCGGSGGVTCTGVSPSSLFLVEFQSGSFTASYSVGATGTGNLVGFASSGSGSDGGSYIIPIQSFDAVVTGGTDPTRVPNTAGYTTTFTVRNSGTETETYSLTCAGSANVTCAAVGPTSVTLGPGVSTPVTVGYSVGSAGTGTVTLTATTTPFSASGSTTVSVGQAAGAPIVDVTPYNYGKQDYSMCAVACFATVYAQSTVPYFSLNTPRNVTLVYNSDRVHPRPFVHINVTPDLTFGQTPTEYRLQVKVNGASIAFVNGDSTLRFTYPGAVNVRLGAQFDASSYTTGVYPMDIVVSALYAAGPVTTDIPTKLVVVNEIGSPVAAGWTFAGIQRLYPQADGSTLITEGEGSAAYFWNVGGTLVAPAGDFSTLGPSSNPSNSRWARTYVDGSQAVFDSAGRMIQLRDRFSNVTTIVYDASGRVSQVKDPLNLAVTLGYGVNGLASITDAGTPARTTSVTVDGTRALTAITDPDNVSTKFNFDATLLLFKLIDRRGDTTQYGYDNGSRKMTFPQSPPVTVLNGSGTLVNVKLSESHYPWQVVGVPYTSTATTAATAPLADTVHARINDSRGFTTTFTVNRWGSPVQTTDALGAVTTLTYDANGLPIRAAHPTGGVDSVAYNSSGLPTFVQPAGLSALTVSYGTAGLPVTIAGAGRRTVSNTIVSPGVVASSVLGGQDTTRFIYDSRGRVSSVTDPQGHLLGQRTYAGANGNLNKDSLPGGRVTTFVSDAYGRDSAVQRPGMALQRILYDVLNRPIQVFDGVNPAPTVTAYDSLFTRSVTDPKGQVFGFSYNGLGWLTARVDPAGRAVQSIYDKNGNLKRFHNRRGDSLAYVYDGLNRLTSKSGSNTAQETWSYSTDGRVITTTSPSDTETVYLNVAGQPDSVRTQLAGQSYVRRYRYTVAGLRDSLDVSGGGIPFKARKWIYNTAFGTLSELHVGGAITTIARNKDLQDTSITFPSGDRVSQQYFPLHRVTQISTAAPYNITIARSLGFDSLGRVNKQLVGDGSTGEQYTYDGLSRLQTDSTVQNATPSSTCDGNPPPIIDPNGNSCVSAGGWQATGGTQFVYDSAGNRRDNGGSYLTANRITGFAGCSYATDNDGNVTSRTCGTQTATFGWTAESRLASITVGAQTVAFQYDAAGWLVRKDVNGTPQSYFLWDGDNLLAELTSTGTAAVAEYSYYGPDQLHALFVGGHEYNAHADGLGNVIALTDSQTVKRSYSYTAWGQLAGGSDVLPFTNTDRARYKGAMWLGPEADVYYMRARWYEPQSGRFLSEDALGLGAGINQYAYASNDPINGADRSGLDACQQDIVDQEAMDPNGAAEQVWQPFCDGDFADPDQFTGPDQFPLPPVTVWGDPFTTTCTPTAADSCDFWAHSDWGANTGVGEGYDALMGNGEIFARGQQPNANPRPNAEVAQCTATSAISGFLVGFGVGFVRGAVTGFVVSGPIALANGARAGVIGGALTVEAGGTGAIPAAVSTYALTRLAITLEYAVGQGIATGVGGAIAGVATAGAGGCPTPMGR